MRILNLKENKNNKFEIAVHSGIAQMTYKLDTMAIKTWFYLTSRVFSYLENENQQLFSIPVNELFDYLGTRNYDHINKVFREIQDTKINFNVLGKSKDKNWISSVLFSTVGIIDGKVVFEIPLFLKQKLLSYQEMFVVLNLILLKDFRTKHALSLYIVLTDFLIENLDKTEKIFSILELKKLFDISDDQYVEYKELNKFVLKKAVSEINQLSNLYVEYEVHEKIARKISKLKFKFKLKKELSKKMDKKERTIVINSEQNPLNDKEEFIPNIKLLELENKLLPTNKKVLDFVEKNKIVLTTKKNQERLEEILDKLGSKESFNEYFLYLIDIVKAKYPSISENSEGKKNIGGFFMGVINSDTYFDSFFIEIEKKRKNEEEYMLLFTEKVQKGIQNFYERKINREFLEYLESDLEKYKKDIKVILDELKKENSFFRKLMSTKFIDEEITSNLIRESMFSARLCKNMPLFGYESKQTFEEWIVEYDITPEGKENIRKIREEVSNELQRAGIKKL